VRGCGCDVVDAEGHLLDAGPAAIEELADGGIRTQGCEQLDARPRITDGQHGLADTLLLFVDLGHAESAAVQLDGSIQIGNGDPDVVDAGGDRLEGFVGFVGIGGLVGAVGIGHGVIVPSAPPGSRIDPTRYPEGTSCLRLGGLMSGSVIVAGARTPMGRLLGSLKDFSAADLGGLAIKAALAKAGVSPDQVDYVIMGQVIQAGAGQNAARQAAVKGGIGMDVPALTINKVCLSGINSIALADQLIRAGEYDVVVAGGMESMTQGPHLLPKSRSGFKYGDISMLDATAYDALTDAFDQVAMGVSTEAHNAKYDLTREEQDAFAARSHQLAAEAQKNGLFDDEIVAVEIPQRKGDPVVFSIDEGVRADTTVETLARLRPAFAKDGTITAGSASQISDGAAAVVVMSKAKAEELGLSWLAEIGAHGVVAGPDASLQEQPANAILKACEKEGITPADLDVLELNEAFAAVGLVSTKKLGVDPDVVNVNGGAIAMGHPVGMSGTRIVLHLAHELKRRGGGIGAAALCGGGGQGDALIVRVPSV